jgi:hypothetical protein
MINMNHHTKFKGDIGLTKVIAHLTERNIDCLLPISEHLPFDLVSMGNSGKLYKIQVKFSGLEKGKVKVNLRATRYNNSKGMYSVSIDKSQVDIFAVYSPDTKNIYYISTLDMLENKNSFYLSLEKPSRAISFNWHEDFLSPERVIV